MHRATTSVARCPQRLLSHNSTYAPSQCAQFSNKPASPMKSSRAMKWTQDSLTSSSSWTLYQPAIKGTSQTATASSGKTDDCSALGMSSSFTWPPKGYQFNPITGRLIPLKEYAHVKKAETDSRSESKASPTKPFVWHDGEVESIRQSNKFASLNSTHLKEDPIFAESRKSPSRNSVSTIPRATRKAPARTGMFWQDGEPVKKLPESHATTSYQPSSRLTWESGDAFTSPTSTKATSIGQSSPGRRIFWENTNKFDEANRVKSNSVVGASNAPPSGRLHWENDDVSPNLSTLSNIKTRNTTNRNSAEQNFPPHASGKLFWNDDVSSPTGPMSFNTTPSQTSGRLIRENDSKLPSDRTPRPSENQNLSVSSLTSLDAAHIWKQVMDLQTRGRGRDSECRVNFTLTPSGQVKSISVDGKPANISSTSHSTSPHSSASMDNA